MKKRNVVLSDFVVLVLIAGAAALLRTSLVSVTAQTGTATVTPTASVTQTASGSLLTDGTVIEQVQSIYRSIYDNVNPSVVNIQVLGTYNYGFYVGAVSSQGSGFVWDTQGHIVTNNHVVKMLITLRLRFLTVQPPLLRWLAPMYKVTWQSLKSIPPDSRSIR